MNEQLKEKLIELVSCRVPTDAEDFCAYDWSGGNADDAVQIGEDCGRTDLARELCHELGIEFQIEDDEDDE